MDDLRAEFIAETRESLETLAAQLVQWEQKPDNSELIDSAFRFVHTVKGSCGFLDLPRLARLSHAAEEVLAFARDGRIGTDRGLVTATLAVIDRIAILTLALETGEAVRDDDAELIAAMLAFLPARPSAASVAIGSGGVVSPEGESGLAPQNRTRSVRISLALLDRLMSGISDLVLSRNEVSRHLQSPTGTADVEQAFARLSLTVAEIRDAIGMLRMQNIDRLFSALPRLLRDLSIELGKQIELTVHGSEVEVDREMVEALRDPLSHILRNAADHGIEPPGERVARGKDPTGRIMVNARQSGNQILVEIADDGRGIDIDHLGQKAISRGLVTSDQWQKMPEKDRLEMIFAPGLSTAPMVTGISGRGVGMDVVRANIHAIGGTIDLENHPGTGFRITLCLPLTLSIIAGLSLRAGGQLYGLSRSSIVEIISLSNPNVALEHIGDVVVANVRGRRFAHARLEDILGVEAHTPAVGTRTLVIIKPAVGGTFALDVEAVIDHEELVVKPAAPLIMATGLYAGTTLPNAGQPMLLLDASGMAAAIGAEDDYYEIANAQDQSGLGNSDDQGVSALLFVAVGGHKQAIRLSAVERMLEIDCQTVFSIGGRLCAAIDDQWIDIAGIDGPPTTGRLKILRLSDGSASLLLAVEEVLDIFTIAGGIVPSAQPDRLEGVVDVSGQPVELLSVFGLFAANASTHPKNSDPPLCFISADETAAHWEREILAPLLSASGYRVSFDPAERASANVIIERETDGAAATTDGRIVRLRDELHLRADDQGSVYRYDRFGLLSTLGAKMAGGR